MDALLDTPARSGVTNLRIALPLELVWARLGNELVGTGGGGRKLVPPVSLIGIYGQIASTVAASRRSRHSCWDIHQTRQGACSRIPAIQTALESVGPVVSLR